MSDKHKFGPMGNHSVIPPLLYTNSRYNIHKMGMTAQQIAILDGRGSTLINLRTFNWTCPACNGMWWKNDNINNNSAYTCGNCACLVRFEGREFSGN